MRRLIKSPILVFILTFVLAACGGGNGASTTASTPSISDEEVVETAERPDQPRVGDCFNDLGEGEIEIVPCSSDHDYEAYALSSSATEPCTEAESNAAIAEIMVVYEGDVSKVKLTGLYRARWEHIVCAFSEPDGS